MNEQTCRSVVYARADNVCELRVPGVCQGRATNYQHRKRKPHCGKQELWTPSNGLAVCGSGTTGCHGYIHHSPARAVQYGWEVRSWDNPAARPVELWHGLVLLDDHGDYLPAGMGGAA